MTAQQARDVAKAAMSADLSQVYKDISDIAAKGDFDMHIYRTLTANQKSELETHGFKVSDVSERNETVINISWK